MKTTKLTNKYSAAELADAFVFRNKLTKSQKKQADNQLAEARKKLRLKVSEQQKLHALVLQLRYRIEDYANSSIYDKNLNFSYFLRSYIQLQYPTNKDFARDINLNETELSQILNNHRAPSENTIIRLELHSNHIINAVNWYKLLEKTKIHELQTDTALRKREEKFVKRRLQV